MSLHAPHLLSIAVGRCQPLLIREDGPGATRSVVSSIRKSSVSSLDNPLPIFCGALGLEGDAQADLTVHGGRDKALYCYPARHYAYWKRALTATATRQERLEHYGALGENLTIAGLDEDSVYVGDLWDMGEVCVQVTLPREPCFKFNAVMGDPQASKKMVLEQACGWYLAVLKPGALAAGQMITVRPGPRQQTVAQAFLQTVRPHRL
jgi:MOSC domain-containing protein YiiM